MNGLNLSGFKKLKEDKKTVTMGHPTGHSITILKSKVSPVQRKQLESLPVHKADGGDVGDDSMESKENKDIKQEQQDQPAAPEMTDIVKEMAPDSIPQVEPGTGPLANAPDVSSPPIQAQAPQAPDDQNRQPSNIPQTNGVDINGLYNQGQRAISENQGVAAQLAKRQADVQQRDIDARKQLNDDFMQTTKDFQDHQQQVLKDYMNGHINSKQFEENQSTTSKVATAIGLLIGGFTGGFNKTGVNPALDWLNGQINRNIEAQKSKLDQQKTVLGANQDLYHDKVIAYNMTKANMNDIYDHQIQLEAAKLGTPQAQAAADAAHAHYGIENGQIVNQAITRGIALKAIQAGGAGLDPSVLGQAQIISPEDAKKEQEAFISHKIGVNRINDLFAQANKEQTFGNLINPQSYKAVDAINSQLIDQFMQMDKLHRYSPEAAKVLLSPDLIKTTDNPRVRALKQNNILQHAEADAVANLPNTYKYLRGSLPQYSIPKPQHQSGDIVYVNGQKGQVLPNGQIKAVQ